MAQTKKLTCDCGKTLAEQRVSIDGISVKAMVCPACHFTTLTKEQAGEFRTNSA